MTPSDQSKSVVRSAARTYLAYRVRCPKCGVYPSRACEDRGVAMRGVHRARDLRYNLIAAGETGAAPGERDQPTLDHRTGWLVGRTNIERRFSTMPEQLFVLITIQGSEVNAYSSPDVDQAELEGVGHLLADEASPEMTFRVVPLQPAKWDSL